MDGGTLWGSGLRWAPHSLTPWLPSAVECSQPSPLPVLVTSHSPVSATADEQPLPVLRLTAGVALALCSPAAGPLGPCPPLAPSGKRLLRTKLCEGFQVNNSLIEGPVAQRLSLLG